MLRLTAIIILTTLAFGQAKAQSFLERLQKSSSGQGTVTVSQSRDIDALVNGPSTANPGQNAGKTAGNAAGQRNATPAKPVNRTEDASQQTDNAQTPAGVDTHKKVLKNTYKTNGYRVQVFAGGNTRNDKQQAEKIGNDIKMKFPNEPVYVHFYSPRWICRVGNYRTYEEAHAILTAIQEAGYNQAAIVKGKITVQY